MKLIMFVSLVILTTTLISYSALKKKPFRLQKYAIFISVMVLIYSSARVGAFLEEITLIANHTRFVKKLFSNLKVLPPNLQFLRVQDLSDTFCFPKVFSEKAPNEEDLLINSLISEKK